MASKMGAAQSSKFIIEQVVPFTGAGQQDTENIGVKSVKLQALSSAVDTDFTAGLIDVYPLSQNFTAGFALIMGDGIIRARFRDSDPEEKMMTPGEICEFNIKQDPYSNVFKRAIASKWIFRAVTSCDSKSARTAATRPETIRRRSRR